MTSEQFVYWLQGFIELNGGKVPTKEQWVLIEEHIKTVFHKVTPPLMPITQPNPYLIQPGQTFPPNTVIC